MKTLLVEKNKIRANLETVKARAGKAQVIAVLKANAYGLGLREMAQLCREASIRRFAVTEPEDAVRLRDWGFGEEEIIVLRSTANAQEIQQILQSGATATVGSYDAALALNGLAESQGMVCDVHIKVDTGMGRYGFLPTEIDRILSVYRYLTNLNVTGTYTHYANAFKSVKKTQLQLDAFLSVVEKIRAAGFEPGMLHASNSEAARPTIWMPSASVRHWAVVSSPRATTACSAPDGCRAKFPKSAGCLPAVPWATAAPM